MLLSLANVFIYSGFPLSSEQLSVSVSIIEYISEKINLKEHQLTQELPVPTIDNCLVLNSLAAYNNTPCTYSLIEHCYCHTFLAARLLSFVPLLL